MLSGFMEMDHGMGTEEHVAVGSCNNNSHVIKGKRTKRRLKPLSPCVFTTTITAVTSSCSSASCGGGGGGSFSSTTFENTADQEEEDMAKCLILLAQGKREREEEGDRDRDPNNHHPQHHQYKLQKAENHVSKSGLVENYECKTCNRTFPSFQALGGHRASHKKPKMQVEKKSSPPPPPPPPPPFPITATTGTATMAREFEEGNYDYKQSNMMMKNIITNAPPVSLELRCGGFDNNKPSKPNKPNKIHECSVCGSEFPSGQALGGHMRRHRASTSSSNNNNNNNNVDAAVTTLSVFADVNVRSRNVLELDLNLPAPEDDFHDSTFHFPVTRESVVLSSAPALVGCHY